MYRAVADTHGLIWYVLADPRLPPGARSAIEDAASAGDEIAVSSISLVEIVYLMERRRIDDRTLDRVRAILDGTEVFREVPVAGLIADAVGLVPRAEVPDFPDRIIAATALHLGVPVITRDGKIRASSVATIW